MRRALLRQRRPSAAATSRNAVAVMRDDRLQALLEIDVAQEPDEAVEQQVLHGGIERKLQRARHLVVERVDLVVERRHAVAVAHRGESKCDRLRAGAGLVGDPHHQRRTAAIDHRVGELRGDDLAAQAVRCQRLRETSLISLREIAAELAAEIWIVRHL